MDNRGIDTDPGWINRQLRELRQAIESLRSERRASAATLSGYGSNLTVRDGARLLVSGGGAVALEGDGYIGSRWPNATFSVALGAEVAGDPYLFVRRSNYSDVFRASVAGSSASVAVGAGFFDEAPVDSFDVIATTTRIASDTMILTGRGALGTTALTLRLAATTSNSANLSVDAGTGAVARSTSARKYKQDIADHDIDPLAVLKMRVRTWRDRAEVKDDDTCQRRYIGFIAEELHDLGLTEFVEYDEDGNPDAIAYDRIPVALLIALRWVAKQVKDERARTDALEAKVATQQKQIDDLAAAVAALTPTTTTTLRST